MTNYNEYTENTLPVLTEHAALSLFDDYLNDCFGLVSVAGLEYATSELLKNTDPTAYRCGFIDWCDAMREEYYIEGFEE